MLERPLPFINHRYRTRYTPIILQATSFGPLNFSRADLGAGIGVLRGYLRWPHIQRRFASKCPLIPYGLKHANRPSNRAGLLARRPVGPLRGLVRQARILAGQSLKLPVQPFFFFFRFGPTVGRANA